MVYGVRSSTPAERVFLGWLVIYGSLGVGLLCLYLGWSPPSDKVSEGERLRLIALGCVGFSAVAFVFRAVFRRWAGRA